MSTRFRGKGLVEEVCPSCKKGCVACFDAGKSYAEPAFTQLAGCVSVIDKIVVLHSEMVFSATMRVCRDCAERWPCKTVMILREFELGAHEA